MSKIIFVLLVLCGLSLKAQAKRVCTYVYNCANCVITVETDPPIRIESSDFSCFDRLKSLDQFDKSLPSNKQEFDSRLLMSGANGGGYQLAASLLVETINRNYENKRNTDVANFYKSMPEIAENEHRKLIDRMQEEAKNHLDTKKKEIETLQSELDKIRKNLGRMESPDVQNSSDTEVPQLDLIGLESNFVEEERGIKNNPLHSGFPTIIGRTFGESSKREYSKNASISNAETRKNHDKILKQSKQFTDEDLAIKLRQEARSHRLGQPYTELSLANRVDDFELLQKYVGDRQSELRFQIKNVSSERKNQLEKIDSLTSQLASEGEKDFYSGNMDEGEHWISVASQIVDIGLGFVPVISTGKDLYEGIFGENLITGEKLELWERGMALVSASSLGMGSIAKSSIKVIDGIGGQLVKLGKLSPSSLFSKKVLQNEVSLFRGFKNRVWKNADEANELFRLEKGYAKESFIEPWSKGRRILEFETSTDFKVFRVFSNPIDGGNLTSDMLGEWVMREDPREILNHFKSLNGIEEGTRLGKEYLRKVYNLPDTNNLSSVAEIVIPKGHRVELGIVGHGIDGTKGGAAQYRFRDSIKKDWVLDLGDL